MKLVVQNLSAETFTAFGQVCVVPQPVKPDHSCDGYDWWPNRCLFDSIEGKYGIGLSKIKRHSLRQAKSERHMKTPELLLPIDSDMIIIVGPPDYPDEPARLPDLSRFAAFRIKAGEAIVMKPGVWHYESIPVKEETYMYCIFQSDTGENDNWIVDFPDEEVLEVEV
jgi:ureidoglycolate hydrolase